MRSNCPPKALLHVAYGILFAAPLVMPPSPRLAIMERQQLYSTVVAHARAVGDAAECSAEASFQNQPENGRVYEWIGDLPDYLPTRWLLVNPFTGARTEPSGAAAAGMEGAVGYSPWKRDGVNVGYTIEAAGRSGRVIFIFWSVRGTAPPTPGKLEGGTTYGEDHASGD